MKRIQEIDALRGFALFGILLVNVFVFHAPLSHYGEFYGAFEGFEKQTVEFVVNFAGGKFMFIFAFLFGYGIVLQQQSRRENFKAYFRRRMLVLLFFGTIHILVFWFGDILASYALLGFMILPFLQLPNRALLALGLLFIMFRPLYYCFVLFFNFPTLDTEHAVDLSEFITIYASGDYWQIFDLRMKEFWAFMPENLIWYIPKTWGLFFIGVYAARQEWVSSIKKEARKYLAISLSLILIASIWQYFKMDVFSMVNLETDPFWRPILIGLNVVFETALGFGYINGLIIVLGSIPWLSKLLAKTGRLALTNYMLQSLVCVLIFYGYGLGFYGKLKPSELVYITIVVFGFNLVFSHFYLKRKAIGPLEYLWRKAISLLK